MAAKKEKMLKAVEPNNYGINPADLVGEGEVTKVKTFNTKPMAIEDVILELKDKISIEETLVNREINGVRATQSTCDGTTKEAVEALKAAL